MHRAKTDEFEIDHSMARMGEKREEGFGEIERRVKMCPETAVLR